MTQQKKRKIKPADQFITITKRGLIGPLFLRKKNQPFLKSKVAGCYQIIILVFTEILCSLYSATLQAVGTNVHSLGSAVNHYAHSFNVCALTILGTARNLRTCNTNLSTKKHILLAYFTLGHAFTSCHTPRNKSRRSIRAERATKILAQSGSVSK